MKKKILPALIMCSVLLAGSMTSLAKAEENTEDNAEPVVEQTMEQQSEDNATPLAAGQTVYVAPYGGGGSDSNSGTTKDKPVQTLDKALELAGAGGTIYLCGKSGFSINKEVTLGNNITFKQESEATSSTIFNVSDGGHLIVNDVTFDGGKGEKDRKYIASSAISVTDLGKLTVNPGAKFTKCYSAISVMPVGIEASNYHAGNAEVTINGGEFYDLGVDKDTSNAVHYHGVISIDSVSKKYKAIVNINDINIHDCVTSSGLITVGGYGDESNVICNMRGGTITNNTLVTNAEWTTPVVAKVQGQFNMSGGSITNNTGAYGAAFFVNEGTVDISGGEISGNTASKYGGAIYIATSEGTVNMTGGTIDSNKAGNYGGAIANGGGTVNVSGGTISNNAARYGGGIAAWANTPEMIISDNALITGNTAEGPKNDPYGGGGGIYIQSGTLKVTGGTISNNTASYGGGIDTWGTAATTIEGTALITENKVTDVDGTGAGIAVHDGILTLNGGTISKNRGYVGTGIGIWNNATAVMDGDTKIIENVNIADADNWAGGAVFVSSATNDGSKFIMKNGTIADNTGGPTWCGGICVLGYQKDTVVQIAGGTISNNTNDNNDDQSILVRGWLKDGTQSEGYLKLSGSPTITGQVLLRTDTSDVVKVDVVDAFSPTQPVQLSVMDSDWTNKRTIVRYAEGLKADLAQFVPYKAAKTQAIIKDGQDLQCMNKVRVIFKDADGNTAKDMYVMPNTKLGADELPTVTKDGYTFKYWKEGNSGKQWDFSQKEISEKLTVFVPEWSSDSKTYTVKYVTNSAVPIADKKVKEGDKTTEPQMSNSKKGYIVGGWYTTESFQDDTKWNFDDPVMSDLTLYAKWELKQPTNISLTADGNVTSVHTGETVKLIATAGYADLDGVTYSYKWYKDGKALKGKTRASQDTNEIEVDETGNYTVKITATDGTYTSSAVEAGPVEVTVTDHMYTGEWKQNDSQHWRECDICGEKGEEDSHAYGAWKVIKEATGNEKGQAERECVVCGHSQTKELAYNEPADPDNNTAPTLEANNMEIAIGSTFEAKNYAKASDAEDGDLTDKIKVVADNVDTTKAGAYEVTYLVTDSQDLSRARTISVTVKEKDDNKANPTTPKEEQDQTGTKETTKTVKTVRTGDEANGMLYVGLAALALVGGILVYRKKREMK